jgi:hypothetical protein
MFYLLCNNNQTDQGEETEGLEREGLHIEIFEWESMKRLYIETGRFTVPPAVALLNYRRSCIMFADNILY